MRRLIPLPSGSVLKIARKCIVSRRLSSFRMVHQHWRTFHASHTRFAIQPYLLADIGEGITECELIQWFVKPGDKIEQFQALCEVQSDKATVEITSRFDGTIKSLHYEAGDMAIVGKPLVHIEIDGEVEENASVEPVNTATDAQQQIQPVKDTPEIDLTPPAPRVEEPKKEGPPPLTPALPHSSPSTKLATPAVRYMLKQAGIDIENITGTGRAGLVTKEDVLRYQSTRHKSTQDEADQSPAAIPTDSVSELTPIQRQMFQAMTRSLTIPHFLFTDVADVTDLDSLRRRLNSRLASRGDSRKLSLLPFIMKALSMAFMEHKALNAHLDTQSNPDRPRLSIRGSHNMGIAVDTPSGLLVPVVRNVQNHSILSLAAEIDRLSSLARTGNLQPQDFKDATFTVSNMGSIGGNALAPVIVSPMVGILGLGRIQEVAAFQKNALGAEIVVKRARLTLSWSGDHRVLDGATVAKCARATASFLENMESVLVALK
ncbi:hypothetical protein IQ07DRAFT_541161, partial [Pyrenochaeta sp. DS3sAY3a]